LTAAGNIFAGSGFYADDNYGTVCCTGHGEMIMKAAAASRVLSSIARGDDALNGLGVRQYNVIILRRRSIMSKKNNNQEPYIS
jgi:hypothetical protein